MTNCEMENEKWKTDFKKPDAITAISTLQEIKWRTSTHMLRVCATDELFQVGIALVSQVLVDADRGSVTRRKTPGLTVVILAM